MTLEATVFAVIVAYIACGLVWSTRFRCWWRGKHDEIKMNVPVERWFNQGTHNGTHVATLRVERQTVWHCKWCGNKRPVRQ